MSEQTDNPAQPGESIPTVEISRETQRDTYKAELFTQLIIFKNTPMQALNIASEAADILYRGGLPFPSIKVG